MSFCPSSTNYYVRIPVAVTGSVEIGARSRLAASAKPRRFRPLRDQVGCHTGNKQRDLKVDQHHMLRVFR
jgi:hypothetical protein